MKFNKLKILMLSALIVPTTSVFSEEESSSVSVSGNVDYIQIIFFVVTHKQKVSLQFKEDLI